MGKQKREKKRPHKENPTGLQSVKDLEKELEEFDDEDEDGAIQRMAEQLQSPNVEEKLSGLQTLESMCCNTAKASLAAKEGIARIAGPLLVDPSNLVRAASASALRHIADNGDEDACTSLLESDIMTPLAALLQKHYTEWQPKPKEKGKTDDEKETFVQAITLLWTLCENDYYAIKYSNEQNLIAILIKCLDVGVYGLDISVAAAQCMLTLSEDNPLAISELKKYEGPLLNLLKLKSEKESESCNVTLMKTLAGGILMNINNSDSEDSSTNTACQVASTISETLTIDHRTLLNTLTSALPLDTNSLSHESEKKLNEVKKILSAQQQALEILANLCSDDQDSDVDSDLEDSDPAEEENESMEDGTCDKFYTSTLPIELTEAIARHNLTRTVWEKTLLPAENVWQILSESPESKTVLKIVQTLRCRAFLCLNNLISSLDVDGLGGVDNLYRMWVDIGTVIFKQTDPNDIELLESATAAMRAALQKLAEARANMFGQLTVADIQLMLNGEQQCPNANVRANLIRILGNLALILTNTDTDNCQELVKHVSIFLLDVGTKETEVWVMAESLDAIMDIYAEDETNQLAADIHLVEKLQTLAPVLNNKIRQQKKKLGDNLSVVSTVKTNLNRFIKYKGRQVAKLMNK